MAEWVDFCSAAYKVETNSAASSTMRNCYLEVIQKGPRAGKLRIRGIPGLPTFTTLPDVPLRGLLRIDSGNRLFAVAGSTVFEVFGDGTFKALTGSVALNNHPVTMATDGFEIAIASGGLLYIAGGAVGGGGTVTPATFTDGTPIKAGTVDFIDQYFIVDQVDSKQVYISNLAPAGAVWDPADTAIKEGYSDNLARVYCDNEQLWLFGFDTTEVWVDTGAVFPFQRIQGAVFKIGCSAPYSVAGAQGTRFWLWQGVVYSAYGLAPQRVSDYGVEEAIKTYGDVSNAEAFCVVSGGHVFYHLIFPSVGRCWVLDSSIGAWHQRDYWKNGQWSQYRARVYANAFNKDLVGDPFTGAIYELDQNTFTDAGGVPLRRQRVAPFITENLDNLRFDQLIIDAQVGVGLDGTTPVQVGFDPQLVMRYSRDRGKTWSNERSASLGQVGDFTRRVIYNQNGSSRIGWDVEITMTDPCPFMINTAYVEIGQPRPGRRD